MIEEIKEAIKKNLSSQVADELQVVLERYQKQEELISKLEEENSDLSHKVYKYEPFYQKAVELDKQFNELDNNKRAFEIEKLEYKIETQEEKYNDVRSLMSDVFRNQRMVYKTSGFSSNSKTIIDGQGFQNHVVDNETSESTTEKVED